MKTKQNRHSKFIERFWAHQDMRYSRLNRTTTKSTEIPLQNLDAQLLLSTVADNTRTGCRSNEVNQSPASSSLDLEWEHEYMNTQPWLLMQSEQISAIDEMSSEDDESSESEKQFNNTSNHKKTIKVTYEMQSKLENKKTHHQTSSRSSWSHISTPDSLEWDVNGDDQQYHTDEDLLDNDTMELLQEIEWLKNRALNETGETIKNGELVEESES